MLSQYEFGLDSRHLTNESGSDRWNNIIPHLAPCMRKLERGCMIEIRNTRQYCIIGPQI
ncbi:MAG TPA: hypothetical protein PK765_03950 [bacterium]|nr:hypothetical protein [bacterium]